MEEQNKLLKEELRLSKEREERLLIENERLNWENAAMQKELRELKGTVERVEECVEMRMRENEERMEKRMEDMMGQVMGMMKTIMGEGAVGGVSSASGNGLVVKEKVKVGDNGKGSDSDSSNSDGDIEDKGIRHSKDEQKGERKDERKGKSDVKKEKKKYQADSKDDREWVKVVSKKKGKKGMVKDRNLSVEVDSLYSNEEEGNKGVDSDDSSENERDVCKTVFMREVPRCERFNEHSSRDVNDFFKEYERYCQDKYGDSKRVWARELGEYLTGYLLTMYGVIMSVGDVDYESVKTRIIEQVKRMKGSVKYKRKNDFDEARMNAGEAISMYVCRLETLARKKYGDEGINENKELMRKFLATVPENVCEFINLKRKEKMRWTQERLTWDDILEIVEDYELDRCMKESKSVSVRTGMEESVIEFGSYKDAILRGPMRVADNVVDRSVRASNVGIPVRTNEGFRQGNQVWRDRSASAPQDRSGSCIREEKCYRCGKVGHKKNECRWALGACFGCGEVGHRISECTKEKGVKCYRCGMTGHVASGCRSNRMNVICGNCGKDGHYARMCKEPRGKCTECGADGHVARVCRKKGVSQPGCSGN
ncbi:uncharacterized protein [Palaemon carinicauda]|uniref:uncharacterized protein n=1 Tax=Palaemon carinicauda TaxID=392227 RepID=UPI0035B67151